MTLEPSGWLFGASAWGQEPPMGFLGGVLRPLQERTPLGEGTATCPRPASWERGPEPSPHAAPGSVGGGRRAW